MARRAWAWVGLAAVLGALSCGPVMEDDGSGSPPPGDPCFSDSDCVPNACCGQGDDAVLRDQGPDCSNVVCAPGGYPPYTVNQGCGLPVCRNSRCTVAVTSGPGCE